MNAEAPQRAMSPQEIAEKHIAEIPDEVFVAFNGLIAQKYSKGRATVMQNAVLERLAELEVDRAKVFENRWLDVEDSYRTQGWDVEYWKPGFNESGNAYFTFSVPRVVR